MDASSLQWLLDLSKSGPLALCLVAIFFLVKYISKKDKAIDKNRKESDKRVNEVYDKIEKIRSEEKEEHRKRETALMDHIKQSDKTQTEIVNTLNLMNQELKSVKEEQSNQNKKMDEVIKEIRTG